ncbi:MAG: VOC family protein [Sporichthyaceae bacterium]
MTVRHDVPPGAPCWVDLMSTDVEGAKAFYGEVFGWVAGEGSPEFGGYVSFARNDEPVAGLMACMDPAGPQNVWGVYLGVADADATVARVKANGGSVIADSMPVGELGTMAVLVDSAQAVFGIWQPGLHRGGVVGVDGAPCHFELHTRNYDAATAFYRDALGWTANVVADDPGGFRYSVLEVGDGQNAGIYDAANDLPDGVPAHWAIYFATADVDKTLATIARLGGSVVEPAMDTPYGRLATAADPAGALFKLRAP